MRILFIGDASAAHYNLAEGLRSLGHEAVVISDGLRWRQFPGHIVFARSKGIAGAFIYLLHWLKLLPYLRHWDVVVLNTQSYISFKPWLKKLFFQYVKWQNKKVVYSCLGIDYYYVKGSVEAHLFKYGDFYIGDKLRMHDKALQDRTAYMAESVEAENVYVVEHSDAVITSTYDCYKCYMHYFPKKTHFIPLCRDLSDIPEGQNSCIPEKVCFFIGIQKNRTEVKGTDVMARVLQMLLKKYPDKVVVHEVENIPYNEYLQIMKASDILLDQLYQYGYGMNGVIAMSKGIVVAGGGEEEMYEEMFHEHELRPVINLPCDEEGVYKTLEYYVLHPDKIPELKRQSLEMVRKYHDNRVVARQFEILCQSLQESTSAWICLESFSVT